MVYGSDFQLLPSFYMGQAYTGHIHAGHDKVCEGLPGPQGRRAVLGLHHPPHSSLQNAQTGTRKPAVSHREWVLYFLPAFPPDFNRCA